MRFDNVNILVPVDFSEPSLHALRHAIGLVRTCGGRITLLHVGVLPHIYATDLAGAGSPISPLLTLREQLAEEQHHVLARTAREEIPESIEHSLKLREGYAPSEILNQVKEGGHDLLVMGTRGHTGLKRVLLGSVTERVLRNAEVPVLTVH